MEVRMATQIRCLTVILTLSFLTCPAWLEDFPVQHKVHSLAVDERTHRVYVPEEEENGKPVARMIVYEPVEGR